MFIRSSLNIALAVALCCSPLASFAPADEPRSQQPPAASPSGGVGLEQVNGLVEQLGDDSFAAREEAMAELIEIGPPAEPAVAAAIESPDPEVGYRARKVIKEIDRALRTQRREAFLAGDVEQLKANAESWRRLEEMVGNTRETRQLFLDMQLAGEDILTAAEEDPKRCAARISTLYQEDQNARRFGGQGLAAGAIAAMVFAGASKEVSLDAATLSRSTSLLYRHRATLGENEPFRRLLGKWVTDKAEGTQQYQFLRLAQQFKLEEGVELARKMVAGGGHNTYKAHAILTLGMVGEAEDVAVLEKLIGDNTTVGNVARKGQERIECKLGDIALAMCLALTDQKAKEYGYPNAPDGRPASTSYYQYGFTKKEQREAARAKWSEWKESVETKD